MNREKWNETSVSIPEEGKDVLVARGNEGNHVIAHIQYDSNKTPHWKQAGIEDWVGDINVWNRWLAVLVG